MKEPERVDLSAVESVGDGVHWTLPMPSDLNVNLVALEPAHAIDTHANDEVDVVLLVLSGDGVATVDGVAHGLRRDVLLHIPRGVSRGVIAGGEGIRYVTVHRGRGPLRIGQSRT